MNSDNRIKTEYIISFSAVQHSHFVHCCEVGSGNVFDSCCLFFLCSSDCQCLTLSKGIPRSYTQGWVMTNILLANPW